MMAYPTPERVEAAELQELSRWHRLLPNPGAMPSLMGSSEYDYAGAVERERAILDRIRQRIEELGGDTSGNDYD
jgi:hypothetical protein